VLEKDEVDEGSGGAEEGELGILGENTREI